MLGPRSRGPLLPGRALWEGALAEAGAGRAALRREKSRFLNKNRALCFLLGQRDHPCPAPTAMGVLYSGSRGFTAGRCSITRQ